MTNDELSIASPPVPTILHTNNWLASKFLLHQGTPPRKKVTETSTPLRYTARKQSYTSFFCRGEPSPNTRKFREGSLQGVWGGGRIWLTNCKKKKKHILTTGGTRQTRSSAILFGSLKMRALSKNYNGK